MRVRPRPNRMRANPTPSDGQSAASHSLEGRCKTNPPPERRPARLRKLPDQADYETNPISVGIIHRQAVDRIGFTSRHKTNPTPDPNAPSGSVGPPMRPRKNEATA